MNDKQLKFEDLDLKKGLVDGYPYTNSGEHVTPDNFPDNYFLTGERVYFHADGIPGHITGRVEDERDGFYLKDDLFGLAGLVETSQEARFEIGLKEHVEYGRSVPFSYDGNVVDGRELTLESITATVFDDDKEEVDRRVSEIKEMLQNYLTEYILKEEKASFVDYVGKERGYPLSTNSILSYLENRGLSKPYLSREQIENPSTFDFTQLSPEQKGRVLDALPKRRNVRWQRVTDRFLTNLWLEQRNYSQTHLFSLYGERDKMPESCAKKAENYWLSKGMIASFPTETITPENYAIMHGMTAEKAVEALDKLTPFQKLLGRMHFESAIGRELETKIEEAADMQKIRIRFGPGMNDYHVVLLPKVPSFEIGLGKLYDSSVRDIDKAPLDKLKAAVFVAGKAVQEWVEDMYNQKSSLAHGQEEKLRDRSDRAGDRISETVADLQKKMAEGSLKPDELADALAQASKQVRRISSELGHAGSEADLYKHGLPGIVDRRERTSMRDE